ncbi:hypothetical protein [Jannaschia aquimarina]|uniref:Uncharacterized protein n=1 Tax=Jannaschia aquimarina TaxID=935700 RepID=A0A0D1CM87_9RHOB|nr:hypothetical protein [Jannaschia aquimarina]KIT15862.1 hypothetical protein jaqu_24420 [Jannaschia aquimarina]SNT10279.1 hypothetical protein SAMN05421775_105258 [Jannaschia aquimarina]
MRRRPVRRRGPARGFALAEALVALAVAAMTLALLTGATWGLRQAAERRDLAQQTGPADWLATRRAVSAWAAGLSTSGAQGAQGRLIGTATTARMVVEGGSRYVAELRVERRGADAFALVAARYPGRRDVRVVPEAGQVSELVRSSRPIRLLYLHDRPGNPDPVWVYETGDDLPAAIAVEVGDTRRLTAAIHPTVSGECLAAGGLAALEDTTCGLR